MTRPVRDSRKRVRHSRKREPDPAVSRSLLRHPLLRLAVFIALSGACIVLLIAAMVLFNYDRLAARYDITAVGRMPLESTVMVGTGELIGYLHGENVGTPVALDQISPHFLNSL